MRASVEKARTCLLCGAMGDCLGADIEFQSRKQILEHYGTEGKTELATPTEFTDDTQMTLFTAEGLG